MDENDLPQIKEETESIKLIKNTKGYNYEIKLRGNPIGSATMTRLEDLNNQMKVKFSNA